MNHIIIILNQGIKLRFPSGDHTCTLYRINDNIIRHIITIDGRIYTIDINYYTIEVLE